jgi:hypothetical protein
MVFNIRNGEAGLIKEGSNRGSSERTSPVDRNDKEKRSFGWLRMEMPKYDGTRKTLMVLTLHKKSARQITRIALFPWWTR